MGYHASGAALGFILLSFLTWSVTFAILVFGVMLRRKILLWDDQWKETVEQSGISLTDFADDLERTHEKIRGTFRLLGFFLFLIVALMGYVTYLGLLEKPVLGYSQVMSSLWLLSLVSLSVILPAFVNFGVGSYFTETMLLKANAFVFRDAQENMREKKMKMRMMEKAKELKAQRDAMRAARAAGEPAGVAKPAAPAAPAKK